MKFFATVVVALVSFVPAVLSQLTINTPTGIVQCQPIMFTWSGGTGPYFLSLIPASQPSAAAIKQFPTQPGNSYTWNVDLPSGTAFSIALKDSTGATAFSDAVSVQTGPDSSCLNTAVTETGSAGAAGPTSAAAGATPPAATSAAGAATTAAGAATTAVAATSKAASVAGSGTVAASVAASAAKSPSGSTALASASASATSANSASKGSSLSAFGLAGLMGLIGAALF